MPPFIFVPKHYSNVRPEWVGEVRGRNYSKVTPSGRVVRGRQLAGHRVLMRSPPPGTPFDPDEHIDDLGLDTDSKRPFFIIPSFGILDREEMSDLAQALREKYNDKGWEGRPETPKKPIDMRFYEYADMLLRQKRGLRVIGPTAKE